MILDDNTSKLLAEEEGDDDDNINRKNKRVTMIAPDAESNAPTKDDVVAAWRDTLQDAKIARYSITEVS